MSCNKRTLKNVRWTYHVTRIWYEATKNTNEFTHHHHQRKIRKKAEQPPSPSPTTNVFNFLSSIKYIFNKLVLFTNSFNVQHSDYMWMEILLIKSFTSGQSFFSLLLVCFFLSFFVARYSLSENTRKYISMCFYVYWCACVCE